MRDDKKNFVENEMRGFFNSVSEPCKPPRSKAVRDAVAIVRAHDRMVERRSRSFRRKIDKARARVRRELTFGTPEKALKLLDQMRKQFRVRHD